MKILQLGKTYPLIGGVDKVIFELSKGISQREIQCDVLCASIDNKNHEVVSNKYSTFFVTKSFRKIAATWISPQMIFKLRGIVHNYDIIHIHHPDPMAALALLFSNTKGKKIVLHWHSDIVKQKLLLKFYNPLQNWMIRRADNIIATSSIYAQGSRYINKYVDKTIIIPIGVEVNYGVLSGLKKQINNKYVGKKIIYSLGRLCYYKGFEYLIDSAKYLDESYVILIGGTGPLVNKLSEKIEHANIGHKVKLLGKIADNEMGTYFSECTLFCFPSIEKSEAFGIVQIEAMSFGKPIIATTIKDSGVSWVNKHGYSGLNVEPRNSQELANAIKNICENDVVLNQYSLNARQRFEDEFTSDKMIDRILKLYDSF